MIIDRERVLEAFNNYVGEFDESDEMIRLKKLHTINVANICDEIGRTIKLSEEEVNLCWLIGMLHDIARFRQHTEYGTFFDSKSFEHAKMGCTVLFEEGLIERFIDDTDSRESFLLKTAVDLHSEYRLPDSLSEEERLYCNIIRDADKVDIFRVACEEPINNVYSISREEELASEISPKVLESFYEHHAIKRELRQTMIDYKVGFVSLSFELVFERSKEIALEQGFLMKIIDDDYTNEKTIKEVEGVKKELEDYLM